MVGAWRVHCVTELVWGLSGRARDIKLGRHGGAQVAQVAGLGQMGGRLGKERQITLNGGHKSEVAAFGMDHADRWWRPHNGRLSAGRPLPQARRPAELIVLLA